MILHRLKREAKKAVIPYQIVGNKKKLRGDTSRPTLIGGANMLLTQCLNSVRLDDPNLESMRREILKTSKRNQNRGILKIIDEELYIKYEDKLFPFDLLLWDDLIGYEIDCETINELGVLRTAEIILEELSFYGMSADENKKKIADMFKRVDCLDYILSLCERIYL